VTHAKPAPPRDDAELVARIETATRGEPWMPHDLARLRARTLARVAEGSPRRPFRFAVAAALASGVAGIALWSAIPGREPERGAPTPSALRPSESLEDSYEEEVLFAPEWIEQDAGFVDGEVLPPSYALASALLDP
jgi:hypothetical protein